MIDKLPIDIQEKIFRGLASRDLGRFEAVCRSFLSTCRQRSSIWDAAIRQTYDGDLVDSAIKASADGSPRAAAKTLREVMPRIVALHQKALEPAKPMSGLGAANHWARHNGQAEAIARENGLNIFFQEMAVVEAYLGRTASEESRLRLRTRYLTSVGLSVVKDSENR